MIRLKLPNISKKWLIVGLVLLVVAIGVVILVWFLLNSPRPIESPITYSTAAPSEEEINKDTYKWIGQGDEPKYINIPAINTGGFIQKVGVDQNKEMAVPTSTHLAGWFANAAKPGQPGLSIIDGHVDGQKYGGIFKNLQSLRPGDQFTIELGNGSLKAYKIIKVVMVENAKAASVLFSQNPKITSQLNLITCGGNFDKTAQRYDKRVIVEAELTN